MKIAIINTKDGMGGGAKATYRLHEGLVQRDINSSLIVREKFSNLQSILGPRSIVEQKADRVRSIFDSFLTRLYGSSLPPFSTNLLPSFKQKKINKLNPDIVHLHWIADGYINIESLATLDAEIIWTLHDMWPLTGGCHYANGCEGFTDTCGNCPQLQSSLKWDLSRLNMIRKENSYPPMKLITPSTWLEEQAEKSAITGSFEIKTIPNGVNMNLFRPRNEKDSAYFPELPKGPLILANSASKKMNRMGIDLLSECTKYIKEFQGEVPTLVLYGSVDKSELPEFHIPTVNLGYVSERKLPLLFSTTDLVIVPSREDNLPNKVLEPMASGTPCVAFQTGGIPDMVQHKNNGYLAEPFESEQLAIGVNWVLNNLDRVSEYAREFAVENFSREEMVDSYFEEYKQILDDQ